MTDKEGAALLHALFKDRSGLATKLSVTDSCNFIYQIGIKMDSHRNAKGKARPHP